jgi:hypothetical protein
LSDPPFVAESFSSRRVAAEAEEAFRCGKRREGKGD